MALTREQANKIKIDGDVIVGFSGSGGDICAEQLAKWAYRRLETWPLLLSLLKDMQHEDFEDTTEKGVVLDIYFERKVAAAIIKAEKGA